MSSFTAPLDVRQVDGKWETTRPMTYHAGTEGGSEHYTVPIAFYTDFASIPRIMWTVVGHPAGRYAQAAVLHDWLYATGLVSRERADGLFLEAMAVLGVQWHLRWVLYLGVRCGGWAAWEKHRSSN